MEQKSAGLSSRSAMRDVLGDLSEPQPRFHDLIAQGGFLQPTPDVAMCFDRASVDHVLRHHDQFSNEVQMALGNVRPLIPVNVDPPNHSKYRKLLDPLFSPHRMDEQEEDITRRANALIDAFVDAGECNFTEDLADRFPSSVFVGMLGLPEAELDLFLELRDGIFHPERVDPSAQRAVQQATGARMYDYFNALIDERIAHPTDDVMTQFVNHQVDGERLSREDILDIWFFLLIAGLDTVTDSLTCFWAFLATHPEHRRLLVDDPSLIPNAVEEMLRWETPVSYGTPRLAREDVTLPNGCLVQQGTAVTVVYGAANVDDAAYARPMDVDFHRENIRHVAFGGGVHRCLGSHLARRELRIMLEEWHRRIPDYSIKPGHEQLEYAPALRHVKDLTLAWPVAG